jgi:uncharacterized protein (DUF427 family)
LPSSSFSSPGGQRHEDLVWTYRAPLPEAQKIAGLACFYDERVDVYIDGVRQEGPRTKVQPTARRFVT